METLYSKIVAQNTLRLRKEAGLSQFALAIEAGIDPKTLNAIEHANANLELRPLRKSQKHWAFLWSSFLMGSKIRSPSWIR